MKSFTLIEVLVGIFLIILVFLGIFNGFQLGMQVIERSKARIGALTLANQEIENIRNLSYELVGVQGRFPDGVLELSTTTRLNSIDYMIEKRVDFVVDAADGIASPQDDCPNDYKKAEVKVSWPGRAQGQVSLVTDISPKNFSQECAAIGGILSVSVFDAFGQMVFSPLIEIKNPLTDFTITTASPETGQHYFSLATATYKIIVSKTGYSQERTYGTDEIATPEKPHPLLLEGQVTEISFSIDRLSSMGVGTRGAKGLGYPIIHNVTFTLTGAKTIGTDLNEKPVYKYSQNQTTNGPGEITISNLEWDAYTFSVNPVSGLDLIEIELPPGTTTTQPINLSPNTWQNVRLILKAENSLLVTVQNIATLEPIFAATTTLASPILGYEKTQYTNEQGQTYFIPLANASYNLDVSAAGYLATSTSISVSGDNTETVKLQQVE